MTDHLDEAAAKAVDLAAMLTTPSDLDDTLRIEAAAHLAYMAGLLRGGGGRPGRMPVMDGVLSPAYQCLNEEFQLHKAAACPDCEEMLHRNAEVRQDRAKVRAQRDELLAAAKRAAEVAEDLTPGLVLDNLRGVIDRIEGDR